MILNTSQRRKVKKLFKEALAEASIPSTRVRVATYGDSTEVQLTYCGCEERSYTLFNILGPMETTHFEVPSIVRRYVDGLKKARLL